MRSLFSLMLCLCLATGAAQAQRTYKDSEAAALRCANTLALTAVALRRADLIGEAEKEVMLGVTFLILDRHVSGTWTQKKAAMAVMRDRRSVEDTIADYRNNAAKCLQQFPIN